MRKPMATPVTRKELSQGSPTAEFDRQLLESPRPSLVELAVTGLCVAGLIAWAYFDSVSKGLI